eukprot:scaffold230_cov353-Prasinococcus_capsulatus_cf.AAC.5
MTMALVGGGALAAGRRVAAGGDLIDAAINSGNSGGPAFNGEGQCVGIAFQSMAGQDADGIGYVIPTPVIQHFIHDFEAHAAYTGAQRPP